ncbi:MAG: hypothetical protein AB1416_14335 [Actinomycetota bacterium]
MAITVKLYGPGMLKLATGSIDLDADTFKLMLVTNANPPDLDADDFRDDRTTGEVANGSGYATGGVTLTGVAVTYDSASDQVRFDCADPSWTFTGAVTWRYGDVYKSRGGAASADELLASLAWDSDQTVSTTYALQIDPAGLLYWDVT